MTRNAQTANVQPTRRVLSYASFFLFLFATFALKIGLFGVTLEDICLRVAIEDRSPICSNSAAWIILPLILDTGTLFVLYRVVDNSKTLLDKAMILCIYPLYILISSFLSVCIWFSVI
jgi:predicted Abi (CAAX) family protease